MHEEGDDDYNVEGKNDWEYKASNRWDVAFKKDRNQIPMSTQIISKVVGSVWGNSGLLQRIFFIIVMVLIIASFAEAKSMDNFRNKRYCEVVVGHGLSAYVYNSVGLNSCPEDLWTKLNVKKIKKQADSSFIYLNGPRYFTMDKVINTKLYDDTIKDFGGIEMRVGGVVKISIRDLLKGFRPYREHHVTRKTTWIYEAGKPVYELISPSKQVFVMQSYSVEVVKLTPESLMSLRSMLKLPKGWQFKSGIIKKDTSLETLNSKAVVVQDSLKNTYQLASHDFLN